MKLRAQIVFGLVGVMWLVLAQPAPGFARAWYYPMDAHEARAYLKGFGQLIDTVFYEGQEELFPFNRFYGYHAGVDLEVSPSELSTRVPVYAVTSGTISYVGSLAGYGGVILLRLDGEATTALYGHVKITDLPYRVGDQVSAGSVLAHLGDAFSAETSRERKHLHFAIYRGTDQYFRGHESTPEQLSARWEDPLAYLLEHGAVSPRPAAPVATSTPPLENGQPILYNYNGRHVPMNRTIIFVIAGGLALLGLGVVAYRQARSPETPLSVPVPASAPAPVPAPPTVEPAAEVDEAAAFLIYTNGLKRSFAAPMYHRRSPDAYLEASQPAIVRVKKRGVTWDEFFKTLPFRLTGECLTTGTGDTFCSGGEGELKFYLNGVRVADLLDRQIHDGDRALISYGVDGEAQIQKQFSQVPDPRSLTD
ncbi:M23 family metallopeptidase [Candidatus Parcubacteria bacterium]|nr:M23 family metallopeptidase [Candidatus Parcubacteria bacterium]